MHYLIKLVLGIVVLLLTACGREDAAYYRLHPALLQQVLQNCPATPPKRVGCDELMAIASQINQLAYQVQMDPQVFGGKIIAAQEKLALYQEAWLKDQKNLELKTQMTQEKQKIAEYLAVVKWLESPEK